MDWIVAKWAESDTGRRVKIYSLTKTGRKQLEQQEARWHRTTGIIERFFNISKDRGMSRDRDLDDEIDAHLAEAVDDYVARGLSRRRTRATPRCATLAASRRSSKCIARCGDSHS